MKVRSRFYIKSFQFICFIQTTLVFFPLARWINWCNRISIEWNCFKLLTMTYHFIIICITRKKKKKKRKCNSNGFIRKFSIVETEILRSDSCKTVKIDFECGQIFHIMCYVKQQMAFAYAYDRIRCIDVLDLLSKWATLLYILYNLEWNKIWCQENKCARLCTDINTTWAYNIHIRVYIT